MFSHIDQMIIVIEKTPRSIRVGQHLAAFRPAVAKIIEEWHDQSVPQSLLMISAGREDKHNWFYETHDFDQMFSELPQVAREAGVLDKSIFMPALDADRNDLLALAWQGLGGMCMEVPKSIAKGTKPKSSSKEEPLRI